MSLVSDQGLQVDYSELEGRRFACLDNCQLCCLCQPELLKQEAAWFKKNFPGRTVTRRSPHLHTALAMKKGQGACVFLEGKRCAIYPNRPHYCRQFPFHVYLGSRAQVELDLSCRGVWTGKGEEAMPLGMELIRENEARVKAGLENSRPVYRQFFVNCSEAGLEASPDHLRREAAARLPEMGDLAFLGRMLELSLEDKKMSLAGAAAGPLDPVRTEELRHAAMETALESLASPDPLSAPVYCDQKGGWLVLRAEGSDLEVYRLAEPGDMERMRSVEPEQVPLLAPEGKGRDVFLDYLRTLNQRDSFLGYAFYLVDDYNYEDELANVYYGAIATAALDLLWRSSLLAHINGGGLDENAVREGIIFYDMDRLDAPTIGSFV
jgi:Fe-S-cluster containining protein